MSNPLNNGQKGTFAQRRQVVSTRVQQVLEAGGREVGAEENEVRSCPQLTVSSTSTARSKSSLQSSFLHLRPYKLSPLLLPSLCLCLRRPETMRASILGEASLGMTEASPCDRTLGCSCTQPQPVESPQWISLMPVPPSQNFRLGRGKGETGTAAMVCH